MGTLNAARLERIGAAFDADVAAAKIPGAVALVAQHGKIVYERAAGTRDRVAGLPMTDDTIFRAASMTKPIVSVAAMMLSEEGRLHIGDPVAAYLPEFEELRVGMEMAAPIRPMTLQDLLRHTSGLTYPQFGSTEIHARQRAAGIGSLHDTNAQLVTKLAAMPLLYQPGTTFEYGLSVDVMGRVIEVVSGQTLDVFLHDRILGPLGMRDTAFYAPPAKRDRIAQPSLLADGSNPLDPIYTADAPPPAYLAGGGGLLTTARDYYAFAGALLAGGRTASVRLLSPSTVALMTSNHLPPQCAYGSFTRYLGINAPLPEFGQGFGLGFSVRMEAGRNTCPGSVGDFCWSGWSGTYFWVDPREELVAVVLTQAPEHRLYYRALMRDLVYAAMD